MSSFYSYRNFGFNGNAGGASIANELWYGAFSDNANQTILLANTAYAMRLNTTETSYGISVVSNDRITVAYSGTYNLQFSAQMLHTGGGSQIATIWFAINGVNVPRSSTDVTITGNGERYVAAWNIFLTMVAGQYAQILWSAPDTSISLAAIASQVSPTRPATPSVIVTMNKVS